MLDFVKEWLEGAFFFVLTMLLGILALAMIIGAIVVCLMLIQQALKTMGVL